MVKKKHKEEWKTRIMSYVNTVGYRTKSCSLLLGVHSVEGKRRVSCFLVDGLDCGGIGGGFAVVVFAILGRTDRSKSDWHTQICSSRDFFCCPLEYFIR